METYFLLKGFQWTFYTRFTEQESNAEINTNHKHHRPNTPIAIKDGFPIFPEREDEMESINSKTEENTLPSADLQNTLNHLWEPNLQEIEKNLEGQKNIEEEMKLMNT